MIELLVVIAIIGILASMILPALSSAKKKAQVAQAKVEIKTIAAAVESYQATYGRYPSSKLLRENGLSDSSPDFTYGTVHAGGASMDLKPNLNPPLSSGVAMPQIRNLGTKYQVSNSELMAILTDSETLPSNHSVSTVNQNHALNPQRNAFLSAKYNSQNAGQGLGTDLLYRDPWGMPYIVTVDMNYDNSCRDAFYRYGAVSQQSPSSAGINGLVQTAVGGDTWEVRGSVAVWSFGPDRRVGENQKANAGFNKDNVLSWK